MGCFFLGFVVRNSLTVPFFFRGNHVFSNAFFEAFPGEFISPHKDDTSAIWATPPSAFPGVRVFWAIGGPPQRANRVVFSRLCCFFRAYFPLAPTHFLFFSCRRKPFSGTYLWQGRRLRLFSKADFSMNSGGQGKAGCNLPFFLRSSECNLEGSFPELWYIGARVFSFLQREFFP